VLEEDDEEFPGDEDDEDDEWCSFGELRLLRSSSFLDTGSNAQAREASQFGFKPEGPPKATASAPAPMTPTMEVACAGVAPSTCCTIMTNHEVRNIRHSETHVNFRNLIINALSAP